MAPAQSHGSRSTARLGSVAVAAAATAAAAAAASSSSSGFVACRNGASLPQAGWEVPAVEASPAQAIEAGVEAAGSAAWLPIGSGLLALASVGAASSRLAGRRSGRAAGTASAAAPAGRAAAAARRAAPESIAATAIANGNFKTLVAALQKAGLVETLSGSTAFTVFAPTDAAFSALLAELGVTAQQLLDRPDLKSILLYHVAAGTAMSTGLRDGQKVGTVQGSELAVKIGGGQVKVGRATVTAADVACSNGVIHVVDKVLLPPGKFDPSKQVGITQPVGFFDPAGFCKPGDEAGFRNLRASEIKHGRVAMMAAVGAVLQHYVKFPGFESVPSGLQAVTTSPGTYGFAALFALSGALELAVWTENPNREPGNFGDPLGLNQYTPEMRDRELNNGRMAMFATIGIIAAELLTGRDGIQQLGL